MTQAQEHIILKCIVKFKVLKARLHYGENLAKLVSLKEHKKYFSFLKHSNLTRFSPQCKRALRLAAVVAQW
jgi:hypothetical protein